MCVLGSAYGWLVLLDHSEGDCILWNPTSMEIIELLNLQEDLFPYNRCILSNSPIEPNCFIVFDQFVSSNQFVYRFSDNWVFKVNYEELGYHIIAMVSFQGLTFGIADPGFEFEFEYEFVTIHMVGDTLEARPLLINDKHPWGVPQPLRSWVTCNMNHLIESPCGNELILVTQMSFSVYQQTGLHFRIFRVDVNRMVCEELVNLDGRTIFIDFYGNGFCCSSESFGKTIKPHSIYYTDEKGMGMHVYNLDDRSTITLLPCSDLDIDLNSSTNYWVDLQHNILDLSSLS